MSLFRPFARFVFSDWTRRGIKFDLLRLRVKLFGPRRYRKPSSPLMHLGSGSTYVKGWVNVDVAGADVNIDLTARPLPFFDNSFEAVVSQHLIEHLDVETEVMPLAGEVWRVLKPGGELWLSTPDMAKICRHYLEDGARVLHEYVRRRDPLSLPQNAPERFVVNTLFFQRGYHRNLFDFELLSWVLCQCGFTDIQRVNEKDVLIRFPAFPPRNDDYEVLMVRCRKPSGGNR
ncbi:MAG: methyltransferase domain-containing protein [bacterium]|nr:methyltransferase domain-containing protein [bacterium]